MILEKIISGGQTGADRGGLDAAIVLGLPHGGCCPKGRRAEDGPIPPCYQLTEHESRDYPPRTEQNVQDSDGTVIFTGAALEGGSKLTASLCRKHKKPYVVIETLDGNGWRHRETFRLFVQCYKIRTLNVAGNRESVSHGIQDTVRKIIIDAVTTMRNASSPKES